MQTHRHVHTCITVYRVATNKKFVHRDKYLVDLCDALQPDVQVHSIGMQCDA